MNIEKLKILRNKISIPIKEAIQLLEQYQGDLIACEKAFHEQNIQKIIRETTCKIELATEEYSICKGDIDKAIIRINNKPIIIATPNNSKEKIGFILYPQKNNGEYYKTVKRNDIFIPSKDFELIIQHFESVYPIIDPFHKRLESSFYIYGFNRFDKLTCKNIFNKIKITKTANTSEQEFLGKVIQWFEDKLEYADVITIFGNL